jgi:hypothetical protein
MWAMSKSCAVNSYAVVGVALAWILLYLINYFVLPAVRYSALASFIFLPAMLRPVAVLLFGPAGVAGLFVGGLITAYFDPSFEGSFVAINLISASAGLFAIILLRGSPRFASELGPDLAGLKLRTILVVTLLTASISSILLNGFYASNGINSSVEQSLAMAVGDTIGSLIMLYLAASGLRLLRRLAE